MLPWRPRRYRYPGPDERTDDRRPLHGVLCMLYIGIQWEHLPVELDFGSGSSCWPLDEWRKAGDWDQLQEVLLDLRWAVDG
ncbi:transposase [Streptomyces rimosus]